jgi:hypothetical protein
VLTLNDVDVDVLGEGVWVTERDPVADKDVEAVELELTETDTLGERESDDVVDALHDVVSVHDTEAV